MAALAHRVRRMKWQVSTPSERHAFSLRATLRAEMEEILLPAFARAFDRIAPDDEVVRIPHLELKLRLGDIGQLAAALGDAVERQFRTFAPVRLRTVSFEWREVLVGYLTTGTIAWQAVLPDSRDTTERLTAALQEDLGGIVGVVLAGRPTFRHRLIAYFRMLRLLPSVRWHRLAEIVSKEEGRSPAANRAPKVEEAMTAVVRQAGGAEGANQSRLAAFLLALAGRPDIEEKEVRSELESVFGTAASNGVLDCADPAKPMPAPIAGYLVSRVRSVQTSRHPGATQEKNFRSDAFIDHRGPERIAASDHRESPALAREFVLSVPNAGLVLLHPFLPPLFAHCGLLESGRVLHLQRAAALMHWLATGTDSAQEFELGFVKLLLGMRPDQPLAVDAGLLTAADREEGEAVLRAILAHWKALGRTSVEGLRLSFLRRPGYLRDEDDGWKLQLETEAFDVLIARLPWGIGMTRLPWMTRPLFTNWPTP